MRKIVALATAARTVPEVPDFSTPRGVILFDRAAEYYTLHTARQNYAERCEMLEAVCDFFITERRKGKRAPVRDGRERAKRLLAESDRLAERLGGVYNEQRRMDLAVIRGELARIVELLHSPTLVRGKTYTFNMECRIFDQVDMALDEISDKLPDFSC